MATFISKSAEQTLEFGERIGRAAQSGQVIGLSGDLGAGKTQLVKGIARGLGIPARVHSPTFALLNEYSGGRLPLFHLDLYRLNNADEVASAGLEVFLAEPAGVAVVEWIERWSAKDKSIRHVTLEHMSENERRIVYDDSLV